MIKLMEQEKVVFHGGFLVVLKYHDLMVLSGAVNARFLEILRRYLNKVTVKVRFFHQCSDH